MRATPLVIIAVTHPETVRTLMRGQLRALSASGLDVVVMAGPGPDISAFVEAEGVRFETIAGLQRDIHPLRDLRALVGLWRAMVRQRPDLVISSTTKAGLLGTIAARLSGVSVRVYLLRGLRLETTTGTLRWLLLGSERLAAGAATHVVAISASLRAAAIQLRCAPPHKFVMLGHGSSNGVDLARFSPKASHSAAGAALRERFGVPEAAPLLGFVGRPVEDKGIAYLLAMMEQLEHHPTQPWLLLVGAGLAGDELSARLSARLRKLPRVILEPATRDIVPYYAAMDVLVFPSLREGLGNALLEAAAMARPSVGFDSTGVRDAIVDGETGYVVPKHDTDTLVSRVCLYLDDPPLRERHGLAAQHWVSEHFRHDLVAAQWVRFVHACLESRQVNATGPVEAH